MALRAVLVALLVATVLLPAVEAHTAVFSADNKVRASVGLLNEPTLTYSVTGLDICFTQNTAAPRLALANVNPANFTVKLVAPDNKTTFQKDLQAQFGKTGCVTFNQPLLLTTPGQYRVNITGTVNGTSFSATGVAAGGAVKDRADLTFPLTNVPNDLELKARADLLQSKLDALQARLDALESNVGNLTAQDLQAQIDALQADLAALDDDVSKQDDNFAPGAAAPLLMVGLAALVAFVRRQK